MSNPEINSEFKNISVSELTVTAVVFTAGSLAFVEYAGNLYNYTTASNNTDNIVTLDGNISAYRSEEAQVANLPKSAKTTVDGVLNHRISKDQTQLNALSLRPQHTDLLGAEYAGTVLGGDIAATLLIAFIVNRLRKIGFNHRQHSSQRKLRKSPTAA